MDKKTAYSVIQQWAKQHEMTLLDDSDAIGRATELARAIAHLRLSKIDSPAEPDYEAVRTLVLDYLASDKSQDPGGADEKMRVGMALETLIQAQARKKISSAENQLYFGCHRTTDSRPPGHHKNPKSE